MSRSSSRANATRTNKFDRLDEDTTETDSLLNLQQKRNSSNTPSYRSFPDADSWSGGSTITPSKVTRQPKPSATASTENTSINEDELPSIGTAALDGESHIPPQVIREGHGITVFRGVLITLSLGILVFLQAANVSLLTTTQGVIAGDLDAFESTTWFTSAYLVAASSLAPIYGKLSYVFPASYCLLGSALIMALGAAITAWSPTLVMFLIGRVVTGIGGAGVLTFAQVLIQLTGERRKGLAQGLLNTGYTIGVAAGAVIAGAIEPHLGWRSLFWLQIPWLLVAAAGLVLTIPSWITSNDRNEASDGISIRAKVASIDYIGGLLLMAAIVCFLYGLASPTFDIPSIILIVTSFAILLPLFVYQEAYRHSDPIIPVKVLKSRGIFLSCIASLGYMMSRWSILFYTPVYATAVRGYPPAEAGSLLVPTNFGFAVGNLLTGGLHIRRAGSFYAACLVTFAIFPATLLLIALLSTASVSMLLYLFLLFLNGALAGAGMNYTLAHIQHLTYKDVRLIAISIFFTFRGFAGTFGATVGGGIFARALRSALVQRFAEKHLKPRAGLLRELEGSPRAVQALTGPFREAAIQGYVDALRTLFLAGVGLAFLTLVLQACTGWKEPADDPTSEDYSEIDGI